MKLIKKLGILEEPELRDQEDEGEIILGNASKIFNIHNNLDYYYFALPGKEKYPVFLFLKVYDSPLDFNYERPPKIKGDPLLDFELYKYSTSKDPPLLGI